MLEKRIADSHNFVCFELEVQGHEWIKTEQRTKKENENENFVRNAHDRGNCDESQLISFC